MSLLTAIPTGLTAFTATNIDDMAILLLFFSQVNAKFRYRDIIVGQYLGFIVLLVISLAGFFWGLFIPQQWIGLLGLMPIVIGISCLVNQEEDLSTQVDAEQINNQSTTSFLSSQTYSVAIITVANGSDNLGIYVPLFASSSLSSLLIIISIFLLLVGVWCYIAYRLSSMGAIANILTGYANILVPLALISLGIFIVLESNSLSLLKLGASCLCLLILIKRN